MVKHSIRAVPIYSFNLGHMEIPGQLSNLRSVCFKSHQHVIGSSSANISLLAIFCELTGMYFFNWNSLSDIMIDVLGSWLSTPKQRCGWQPSREGAKERGWYIYIYGIKDELARSAIGTSISQVHCVGKNKLVSIVTRWWELSLTVLLSVAIIWYVHAHKSRLSYFAGLCLQLQETMHILQ